MRGGRRRLATLAAATAVALASALGVSPARAGGVTAEQLIAIAQGQFRMTCTVSADLAQCATPSTSGIQWTADIRPGSGLVTSLVTTATQTLAPMDAGAVSMMDALHEPTCTDTAAVDDLVKRVAALGATATIGPLAIGDCVMSGDLAAATRSYVYRVVANVSAPSTPTPTPTLKATPTAAATPSVTATPRSTNTASPTGSASVAPATASPSAGGTVPSENPSPEGTVLGGVIESGTPSVSPSPEEEVAGVTGTPEPRPVLDERQVPGLGLAASVVSPSGIRTDPPALAASGLLALLLLLFMAFPGELFNSTVAENYDEVSGWVRRIRVPGLALLWRGAPGVVLLLAVGALVYSLLDPGFGIDLPSLASYVGMLAGLVIVLIAVEMPGLVMHRRRTGEVGSLHALPWTLMAGGLCVLISRLANFEPGYLYGVLLGITFRLPQGDDDDGRQAAAGAAWTLAVALAAWFGLGLLRGSVTDDGFVRIAAETALAAVVVAGLEAVAFGMVPMRFLDGGAVRAWSRPVWALLFAVGVFAFIHVLVGPQSGYLAELAPGALAAALAVFVAFALLSFGVWGYFRFRPARGT